MKYLYVILTIIFTTYGQLVIKIGVNKLGNFSTASASSIYHYFFKAFTNLWILSGLFAALLAALCWIAAMSKFELSTVYPFQSINFILVPALSIYLFQENFNWFKVAGVAIIVVGIFVFSKGV